MRKIVRAGVLVATSVVFFLTACNSNGSSSANASSDTALNLAGTWTVTTTSTQGHGSSSATANISQSGTGLGVSGTTTLSTTAGQIALTQNGTALSGTITNALKNTKVNFSGTLSNGNLSLSGSAACSSTVSATTSLAGTVTANKISGTYTITRPAGCYYPNDAGTFSATKQ